MTAPSDTEGSLDGFRFDGFTITDTADGSLAIQDVCGHQVVLPPHVISLLTIVLTARGGAS